MRSQRLGLGATALCGLILGTVPRAEACSCGPLIVNELVLRDGRLPENAAGIPWWLSSEDPYGYPDAERNASARAERWNGSEFVQVDVEIQAADDVLLIVPTSRWSAGDLYRFAVRYEAEPGEEQSPWAFQQVQIVESLDAQLAPTVQATPLDVTQTLLLDRGGSCALQHNIAYVDLHFSWPNDGGSLPVEALFYRTLVDGEQWEVQTSLCSRSRPGGNGADGTRPRVHASCGTVPYEIVEGQWLWAEPRGAPSAGEGLHVVTVEAWLPGTDIVFRDEVEIDLQCPPQRDVPGAAPQPPARSEGAPGPSPNPEPRRDVPGSISSPAAGAEDSTPGNPREVFPAQQRGTSDVIANGIQPVPDSSHSGCSLTTAPGLPSPDKLNALALLGLVFAARRRPHTARR